MKSARVSAIALAALLWVGIATPAMGQLVPWRGKWVDAEYAAAHPSTSRARPSVGETPRVYGTTSWGSYAVGPCDAYVRSTSDPVANEDCSSISADAAGEAEVGFPIHLPSGAVLSAIRIYYYGDGNMVQISAGLYATDSAGNSTAIADLSPDATTEGATSQEFGPFDVVIDNDPDTGYAYNILAIVPTGPPTFGTTKIFKINVLYKLQVSPAPAMATFSDVPVGAFAFQHIEALAASGITAGCGGGMFCPNATLTRAQMAVFLAEALGLHFQY